MRYIEEVIHEFGDTYIPLRFKVKDDINKKIQDGWSLKYFRLNDGYFKSQYCITYKMVKFEDVD